MEEKKERKILKKVPIFLAIVACLFIFSIFITIKGYEPIFTKTTSSSDDGVKYDNPFCVYLDRPVEYYHNGTPSKYQRIEESCTENLVYDAGLNFTVQTLFLGGSFGNFTNITLNNASAATAVPVAAGTETNTYFTNCGFASKAGTATFLSTGKVNIVATFTSTCDGLQTNVSRLTSATGNLFAGSTFSLASNINTNDQFTANWTVNATSG